MNEKARTIGSSWSWVLVVLAAATGCSEDAGDGGNAGAGAATGAAGVPVAGVGGTPVAGAAGAPIAGVAGTPMAGDSGTPMAGDSGTPMAGDSGTPMAGTAGGAAGAGGVAAGAGGMAAGEGGMAAGEGGMAAGEGGTGGTPASSDACTPAPGSTFATEVITGTGPDGNYTIVQPATLGEGGFLHPPVAWGNGLGTRPTSYTALLEEVASNGFVVIANPGTGSNPTVVRQGLEWLLEQNSSGTYAGKLAVDCAGTIGYSMGGGAAVGSGSHPAVKAIVSIHGLQDAAEDASGPILLTTSEADTFVTKSGYVAPCYERSSVQPTILASHQTGSHTHPIGDGGEDTAPAIAWLRYWIYGDQSQRDWFFGDACTLCDWPDFRRKNLPEWD